MKRRNRADTVTISGWLFADLLLGLAMLFFVFNSVGKVQEPPPVSPTNTPTPTAIPIPPTPTASATPTLTATATNTSTPMPTATTQPTYTPYPTFTRVPTATPRPTYTPLPTYTPWPTPTPGARLSREPHSLILFADANALLGPDEPAKNNERQRIGQILRRELGQFQGQRRAGIVLTFGTSPKPSEGNILAHEVNALLLDELQDIFEGAVFRDFHFIANDGTLRGEVEILIYFLIDR